MKKIAERLTDLVGNTPLLELNNYNKNKGLKARVIAKLEYFNPAGSVKDRVALAMIEDAEAKGLLAWCHHHRTYQWEYGRRAGFCGRRQRLQADTDDARHDEFGTPQPLESPWCGTGTDFGCRRYERRNSPCRRTESRQPRLADSTAI